MLLQQFFTENFVSHKFIVDTASRWAFVWQTDGGYDCDA